MGTDKKITIRRLMPQDNGYFPEAVDLLNRTQGLNLVAPNYLDERSADPKSFVAGAFDGDNLVGIATAQIISSFSYYAPFDANIANELQHKIVGSFSAMSVVENMQGHGVGQLLSQKRLEWLKLCRCDVVVGVSWVSGLAHTSNRVFEKMGFKAVNRVEGFYQQWSIDKNFVCPVCGGPPCHCAAIMYRLDLNT